MAMSKCAKCEWHLFEIKEFEPTGSRYKIYFVQCTRCGVPVGTMEYQNTAAVIGKSEGLLKEMEARLKHVEGIVVQMANAWNRSI